MEEILNSINNPFDFNSFKKLINIYLASKDWYEFYSNIVTYYQDRDIQGVEEGEGVKKPNDFVVDDYIGSWKKLEYFSSYFPTEHRIYINSSLDVTSTIVQKFIDECVKYDYPFELKYIVIPDFYSLMRNDGIVIGSNTSVYEKHIDILRKIAKENPELIEKCGTPHILTSNLDGWLGLADENINERSKSYTQSRLDMINIAIMKFLLKHEELGETVNGFEKVKAVYNRSVESVNSDIEDGIIDRKDYDIELNKKLSGNLERSINLDRKALILLLSNNETAIQEIYSLFQEECELQGIDPNMPTLYNGSKEALINLERETQNESKVDFDGKSPISIINEYFKSIGSLSIGNSIQALKLVDERFYRNSKLINFMIDNWTFLVNEGLVNENEVDMKFLELLRDESIFFQEEALIRPSNNTYYPEIDSLIALEGKEKAEEIINSRINEMRAYFSTPIELVEEKKRCVENLKRMYEYYKRANPYFNRTISSLQIHEKIKYMEFEIEHDLEIRKLYKNISSALERITISEEDIKKLLDDSMPETEENYYELLGGYSGENLYTTNIPLTVSEEEINEYNRDLKQYLESNVKQVSFSARDLGEASYDADTTLCVELDKIVKDLQRGVEKDGQSQQI